MAKSKFDRVEYASLLKVYLPSIKFDYEDPYDYAEKLVKSIPLPACVYAGIDDISGFRIYLNRFRLEDLHAAFNKEQFDDIVFDPDIRRKIDAMSLSPVFRKIDIIREFSNHFDAQYITVYLDCFANFFDVENKNSFIAKYIGDPVDLKLFKKIITTSSRAHLKVIIGIKSSLDPKTIIEKSLGQIDLKADIAFDSDDDDKLERFTKLRIGIAERLIKMGAGNKSDLDNLMEALNAEPEFTDPVIYRKEDLEAEFEERQNNEIV